MLGSSKSKYRAGALAIGALLFAQSAQATDMPVFPAEDYGKVILPLRQSIGGAVSQLQNQGAAFEPISRLRKDSALRRVANAVGRLDLLVSRNGQQSTATCTASVVAQNLILTNYHCIPGQGGGKIVRASLLLGYDTADGKGTTRVEIEPQPVEADRELDYALARIRSALPHGFQPLRLSEMTVKTSQLLTMIHHPAGQPKKLSRVACFVAKSSPAQGPALHHTCDTLPGSSGGLLFNERSLGAIALHHSGGLTKADPDSFNRGTLMKRLVAVSQNLRRIVSARPARSSQPGAAPSGGYSAPSSGGGNIDIINDLINRGH